MIEAFFTGLGVFLFFFSLGFGLVVGLGNLRTTAVEKARIGGIDQSWYAFALFAGILLSCVAETIFVMSTTF